VRSAFRFRPHVLLSTSAAISCLAQRRVTEGDTLGVFVTLARVFSPPPGGVFGVVGTGGVTEGDTSRVFVTLHPAKNPPRPRKSAWTHRLLARSRNCARRVAATIPGRVVSLSGTLSAPNTPANDHARCAVGCRVYSDMPIRPRPCPSEAVGFTAYLTSLPMK
jgi:hypothetical protein